MTPLDLDECRSLGGLWYLGTPYSKYPDGIHEANRHACEAAAWLIRNGVTPFCPIAHSHAIAIAGQIDPLDHEIWIPLDEPFMEAATGLIVCGLDGWQTSHGLRVEIANFQAQGKPIRFMEWSD